MDRNTLLILLGVVVVGVAFSRRKTEVRPQSDGTTPGQTLPSTGDPPRGWIRTKVVPSL